VLCCIYTFILCYPKVITPVNLFFLSADYVNKSQVQHCEQVMIIPLLLMITGSAMFKNDHCNLFHPSVYHIVTVSEFLADHVHSFICAVECSMSRSLTTTARHRGLNSQIKITVVGKPAAKTKVMHLHCLFLTQQL